MFIIITVLVFALYYLCYRLDKTSIRTGLLFDAGLLAAFFTYGVEVVGHPSLLLRLPFLVVLVLLGIVFVFGVYVLVVFLFLNARIVRRRERRSLSNSLTLILAFVLLGYILLTLFVDTSKFPQWLQAANYGLACVGTYYLLHVFSFLTTLAICNRVRPRPDKDYIIVLGGGLIDGNVTPLLAGRIERAMSWGRLQQRKVGKLPMLIMSGGQGSDEPRPEAEAMAEYAIDHGYDEANITKEDKSSNTLENMRFSAKLMNEGAKCIYATSNFHVLRAGRYARKAGLKIDGIGSRTALYYLPNAILREYIALLSMQKKRFIIIAAVVFVLALVMFYLPVIISALLPYAVD